MPLIISTLLHISGVILLSWIFLFLLVLFTMINQLGHLSIPENFCHYLFPFFLEFSCSESPKRPTLGFLFFKYKFIYFNWRLITLQYCIGFARHQHESAMGIHGFPILKPLPPPSLYHPSGSSQCTSPKHPVSCIKPGLVIRFIYDIIHVSMPFSQIIPP